MSQSRSPPTSRHSPSEIIILLSGEGNSLPEAEARSLVRTYDKGASLSLLEPRVLLAVTTANPDSIARRIAYARRVGTLIPEGRLDQEARNEIDSASFRLRRFSLRNVELDRDFESDILKQLDGRVDLENPSYEISVVKGRRSYVLLSKPGIMNQGWAPRRPRNRAFFHPSAIFPKLSRALVNLSGVKEREVLLDPFAGTGSILLEASLVGAYPVGLDLSSRMTRGAIANQKRYNQSWLGVIRADSLSSPLRAANGIATDIPYGRASSTFGERTEKIAENFLKSASTLLPRGRLAVLMHPKHVRVEEKQDFEVEAECELPVHRNLTRVITSLRRT